MSQQKFSVHEPLKLQIKSFPCIGPWASNLGDKSMDLCMRGIIVVWNISSCICLCCYISLVVIYDFVRCVVYFYVNTTNRQSWILFVSILWKQIQFPGKFHLLFWNTMSKLAYFYLDEAYENCDYRRPQNSYLKTIVLQNCN